MYELSKKPERNKLFSLAEKYFEVKWDLFVLPCNLEDQTDAD